jgi:hypothetical protein
LYPFTVKNAFLTVPFIFLHQRHRTEGKEERERIKRKRKESGDAV